MIPSAMWIVKQTCDARGCRAAGLQAARAGLQAAGCGLQAAGCRMQGRVLRAACRVPRAARTGFQAAGCRPLAGLQAGLQAAWLSRRTTMPPPTASVAKAVARPKKWPSRSFFRYLVRVGVRLGVRVRVAHADHAAREHTDDEQPRSPGDLEIDREYRGSSSSVHRTVVSGL